MENKNNLVVYVRRIWQVDNCNFSIEWSDNTTQQWNLTTLQSSCPCAGCVDETTGRSIVNTAHVKKDLSAVKIVSVGRYAIRIQYTSGCSNGIYGYDMLRQCGKDVSMEVSR